MSRVSGENLPIDEQAVLEFFDRRAERATSDHPLTSVLYQDQHPELAEARDAHEKAVALPLLRLDGSHDVLDVGCGIGRWAEPVAALAATYCGIDFSAPLVEAARARTTAPNASFLQLPMQLADRTTLRRPRGFDRILMAGVLIYVNDDQMMQTLAAVASCAADDCLVYLREPVATDVRLTLENHWSSDLGCAYSAIYRTDAELLAAIDATLGRAGFAVDAVADLFPDSLNNRTETLQRYYIVRRG